MSNMNRASSIQLVIDKADDEMNLILTIYPAALESRQTTKEFSILVNDCLHHRRQALDFIAHDIDDAYRGNAFRKKGSRVYFPFASRTDSPKEFEKKLREWFPKLDDEMPKVFDLLLNCQQYAPGGWLQDFQDISNMNKHDNIVGHMFNKIVNIDDRIIVAGPNAGALIIEEGGVIRWTDGQKIEAKNSPIVINDMLTDDQLCLLNLPFRNESWFDFRVDFSTIPVMDMLVHTKNFVNNLFVEMSSLLK